MAKAMTLREWLNNKGLTPEQFAAQIGRERTTIYRILKEDGYAPRADTLLAIQTATRGRVTMQSLMAPKERATP